MKIHNGKLENAFVLEVDVGENPAWEVDYGEVQIYPDTATGVEALAMNTDQLKEGTLEWCYWVHAMRAVKREQSAKCNVKLTVAGKTYSVGMALTGYARCDFNATTGILRFAGGQEPALQKLTPGTLVTIVATIPKREDTTTALGSKDDKKTRSYDLPLLKGTKFRCEYDKGGKKEPGGMILTVKGTPSGQQFVYAYGNQAGHWRGHVKYTTPPSGLGNYVWNACEYKDEWKAGDTGYTVEIEKHMGSNHEATPIYPAFTRTWNLPVRGILFSQAER